MATDIHLKAADNIRLLSMAMVENAKSGHPGGAMGGADYIHILFSEYMSFDPGDPSWNHRDRFFLDPGHMSPMLYSVLALYGILSIDELKNFRQWGSHTPGHPEVNVSMGIENTSGPLGQGHTNAVGAAIAAKFLEQRFGEWMSHTIFTYISDGGIQEEISQGAGRIAGHLGLGNLVMFYDSNDIQLSTETKIVSSEDTAAKYRAWNWHVVTIDGNNHAEIRRALDESLEEKERPSIIIGKTVMGRGLVDEDGNSFEGKTSTHGQPVSKAGASFEKSMRKLGGDPEKPFNIFKEVKELYNDLIKKKKEELGLFRKKEKAWAEANPGLAAKLDLFFSGTTPPIDYKAIEQKEGIATRAASSTVLSYYAERIENMIVSSADLANSDKTDGFLKKTTEMKRGDFSGRFLQAGVSELTLAAIMNGMALHGGVIPVCGTFFVFSDFMKPAVRLAALMELPVKYVWSHDAFRVGEDGPTHQPVEQEAQIRLLEQLKNHSGKNSMLVLRPADAAETTVCWQMALENTDTPTALILSRQNIKDLPSAGSRYEDALGAKRGAYIVSDSSGKPDVVLLASGSEVSTLIEGAELLQERKNFKVRVVSVPSEGLFRRQDRAYQDSVLPAGIPRFGLTAGLPVNLAGLVGANGKIWGLDHFGYSAPYKVLDEEFGFTAENVYQQLTELLSH
ncbi:MAG: transketolase [Bacteroidales bacterium]|jgi:transketolase|nr:transketolase [Bacteroidales bacterium]